MLIFVTIHDSIMGRFSFQGQIGHILLGFVETIQTCNFAEDVCNGFATSVS